MTYPLQRITQLLGIGAFALLLSSCAGSSTAEADEVTLDEKSVTRLAGELGCVETRLLNDDVYHYDTMKGFDCLSEDGDWLRLRAYESETSINQVLVDWAGALDEETMLLEGKNWFAIGSPQRLVAVEQALGISASHGTEITGTPEPLTREQEAIRACTVGIVTIVRNDVLGTRDAELEESYNDVFPGTTEVAAEAATELNARDIQSEDDFEYAVPDVGPDIKAFCATLAP